MTALLFVVALLAQQPAPETRTVKVRVLHGDKPAPADTEVRLMQPSMLCGTAQYRGATMRQPDAEGWVTFEGVEDGASILAEQAALGRIGLGGERFTGPGPFTLEFPVGRPLSGRVLDARGRPVLRARVEVLSADADHPSRIVVVNEKDGSFLFGNLQKGSWLVVADAFDDAWSPAVEVPAGTSKVDLELPARAWFSGRVLDGNGRPVPEPWLHVQTVGLGGEFAYRDLARPRNAAEVKALKEPTGDAADPRKWQKSFGGDGEGRFELFVPTSQPVEVWAEGPTGSCAVTPRVKLSADQPAELRLPTPATIKLKALGAKKATLPKVTLTLRGDDELGADVDCSARTLELDTNDGVLVKNDVPIAFKLVEVRAPFHQPVMRKLKLAAGKEVDLGPLQLLPGARVAGRVVDAKGEPAGYVEVWLGSNEIAMTDKDGRFVADGLKPGPGELRVKNGAGERGPPVPVKLVAGAVSTVELKLK